MCCIDASVGRGWGDLDGDLDGHGSQGSLMANTWQRFSL
jgi:hypothetical protein